MEFTLFLFFFKKLYKPKKVNEPSKGKYEKNLSSPFLKGGIEVLYYLKKKHREAEFVYLNDNDTITIKWKRRVE